MVTGNQIGIEDVSDSDFIGARELISDGADVYLTLPILTTSALGVVVLNITSFTNGIIRDRESPVEVGDILLIAGATPSGADGYYTVGTIDDSDQVTVIESMVASTGGSAEFVHPSGASRVGFDSTNLVNTSADNVQDAIDDIDFAVTGGGISANTHKILRQLVHLADGVGGPWEGFTSGAFREILPASDPFPVSITWYTNSGKLDKIVEKTITRNSNKTPSTIEWKAYDTDGFTVVAQIEDAILYDGIFELSRTRTIIV
jgi:hypothetical protein